MNSGAVGAQVDDIVCAITNSSATSSSLTCRLYASARRQRLRNGSNNVYRISKNSSDELCGSVLEFVALVRFVIASVSTE